MKYTEIEYPIEKALSLEKFKEMDYFAVNNYSLPIELMMENAGLQLANFVASFTSKDQIIKIGIGNGNNGGGGLVAARRLAGWEYTVFLDIFTKLTNTLPVIQLERALKFGAKVKKISNPDVWVDAYLGFSQRLPLEQSLLVKIKEANSSSAIKVSLDIPTGFIGNPDTPYFKVEKVLTLAAPKIILYNLPKSTKIYVADIGIPKEVYKKFGIKILPFNNTNIFKIKP